MFSNDYSLVDGFMTFSTNNNGDTIFVSSFYLNGDVNPLLQEENFSYLINFLNYDVSTLNNTLNNLYSSIIEDSENDITEYLKKISVQLKEWHPFFQLNTIYYICDLLIYHAAYELAHIILNSEDNYAFCLAQIINSICIKITDHSPNPDSDYFASDLISYFQNKYATTSPLFFHWNPHNTLLGYIEEFREYLAVTLPQVRYDSKPKEWHTFFNDTKHLYGSAIFFKEFLIRPSPSEEFFHKGEPLAPKDVYSISTFPQYILAQIETVKQCKYALLLCCDCGKFYLRHPHLKNHMCTKNEYYKDMNKIYENTYKKLYSRAERIINNPKENIPDSTTAIEIFRNSGLLEFHNKTYNTAIRHQISSDSYSSYTNEDDYTFLN